MHTHHLKGTCHCGNITVSLHTDISPENIIPRNCSCTLCMRHGASWISDPNGFFEISYTDKNLASFYRFGTKTADFISCKNCGVLVAAISEIDGKKKAVTNRRTMIDYEFSSEPVITNFDGETEDSRLQRRGRNWTPVL